MSLTLKRHAGSKEDVFPVDVSLSHPSQQNFSLPASHAGLASLSKEARRMCALATKRKFSRKKKSSDVMIARSFSKAMGLRAKVSAPAKEPTVVIQGEGIRRVSPETKQVALAAALERGRLASEAIIARDDMLNDEAFAALLSISRQTLPAWRKQGKVLALQGAKRGYRYPAWQVDPRTHRLLDGLDEVLKAAADPWDAYFWLTEQRDILEGKTGIDCLESGLRETLILAIENAYATVG